MLRDTPADNADTDDIPVIAEPEPQANVTESDDAIVIDDVRVGFVDRDGNVRLGIGQGDIGRIIGHIANDRERSIAILRERYTTYIDETQAWCEETRTSDNGVWRIHDCERLIREVGQQYVLGDLDIARDLLTELKGELEQQQRIRLDERAKMIKQAAALSKRTDWKDTGIEFDALNDAFKAVGATGDREKDQAQWDEFKAHEREFRANRKQHYEELNQEFAERATAKQKLCEIAEEIKESADFRAVGQRMRELMDEWKTVGFAGREHDDELWHRFQSARKHFNDRRATWFSDNAKIKQELTEKAEELVHLDDAAAAHQEMKSLMETWRTVGSAGRETDQSLWTRFRAAQENIYQRSRAIFDERRQERERNYDAKEAIIREAESLIGKDSHIATSRAKELQQQWKGIGPVPHDLNERQWQRFRSVCDSIFRIAQVEGKRRVENARERAEEHIRKLSAEIDEHERKIAHWQGVIANLREDDKAEEIRTAMLEKIDTAKQRIELKLTWIEEEFARMTEMSRK